MAQCTSRKLFGFRLVRCRWSAEHVKTSKWHCDESTLGGTGYIWRVKERERG